MKKIILLIFISIISDSVLAQQFPLQSQYQFNYSTINPAAVGENDFYSIRTSLRQQWVGLTDNAISTGIMSVNKGFGVNGLGITIFNDHSGGSISRSGASLSYSHRVSFSNSNLYFGVSAGSSKINIQDINDPALINTSDVIGEAIFGVYFTKNNWKAGMSVPGLLNSNIDITNSSENTVKRNLYSMISYKYDIDDQWSLYPSILMKSSENINQLDVNLNVKLRNKLWFGTSYRQDFGPTIYVGIDFGRIFTIYSDDISTNEASSYSNGSHEITIGYDFIPESLLEEEKEKEKNILDKDGDGVLDADDMCPEEKGDILSRGCPDTDKDGVPNKYDLCPNLFGSEDNQGCPILTQEEEEILSKALGDLRFGFDKDEIDYSSYIALTDLTVLMHKNPNIYLLIEGHASPEGSEKYNLNLSARRAKSVQKFFIERGIDKSRMIIDFHGEDNPKNDNITEDEKAENRRVEFAIKYHLLDSESANSLKKEYDNFLNQDSVSLKQNVENLNEEEILIEDSNKNNEVIEENIENSKIIQDYIQYKSEEDDTFSDEIIENDLDTSSVAQYGTKEFKDRFESETKTQVEGNFPEREENDQLVSRFKVTFDSIIFENPENEQLEENNSIEKSEEDNSISEAGDDEYLLVIHVLNSLDNAISYVNDSGIKCNYKYIDGKYYIYIYSSPYRSDVVWERDNCTLECWIKNPLN